MKNLNANCVTKCFSRKELPRSVWQERKFYCGLYEIIAVFFAARIDGRILNKAMKVMHKFQASLMSALLKLSGRCYSTWLAIK